MPSHEQHPALPIKKGDQRRLVKPHDVFPDPLTTGQL